MGAKYKMYKVNDNINDNPGENYFPRFISSGTIDLAMLAKQLSEASTLTPGDIYNVMVNMRQQILTYLKMGFTVKLDNLGTFSIIAESTREAADEKLRANAVKFKRVKFRTAKSLNEELKDMRFEPVK